MSGRRRSATSKNSTRISQTVTTPRTATSVRWPSSFRRLTGRVLAFPDRAPLLSFRAPRSRNLFDARSGTAATPSPCVLERDPDDQSVTSEDEHTSVENRGKSSLADKHEDPGIY